jgi:cyanophycinase
MEPARLWDSYGKAFAALGAEAEWLDVRARPDADAPRPLALLARTHVLFMTGGDQDRLGRLLNGTQLHRQLLQRHRAQGMCVAGTSAGASIMGVVMPGGDTCEDSGQVLAGCEEPLLLGLGLLPGVAIDQHFTQRRRLARLIDLASQRNGLLGMGIDEDTAALIQPGPRLTVVGSGSVTLVDCRAAVTTANADGATSLRGLVLHRVAAGTTLQARHPAHGRPDLTAVLPS